MRRRGENISSFEVESIIEKHPDVATPLAFASDAQIRAAAGCAAGSLGPVGLEIPVIVKETGCGISGDIARKLVSAGAACLDIGGAGGTSFTRVEHFRGSKSAAALFEWGIPTAESLRQCRRAVNIPLIASGGIRTGVECAKALAMGASLVGFALPVLKAAQASSQAVVDILKSLSDELKRTMLLLGTRTIEELKQIKVVPL